MTLPPSDPSFRSEADSAVSSFAEDQSTQVGALEAQVAQAQSELEEYQRLLNELPGIYEDKFRQKVRSVAQDLRQLLDERKALQQQVERALAQPRVQEALPAVSSQLKPRLRPLTLAMPRFDNAPRRRLILLAAASLLVLLGAAAAVPSLVSRRVSPVGTSAPSQSPGAQSALVSTVLLRLQARGGESWVLVEDLDGGRVFDAILQPGEQKDLPLGKGLRLRSGRPDLLFVSKGADVPKALGDVGDLDWVDFRP